MGCITIGCCCAPSIALTVRSQQGPLQASIEARSAELAELVGMLARALRKTFCQRVAQYCAALNHATQLGGNLTYRNFQSGYIKKAQVDIPKRIIPTCAFCFWDGRIGFLGKETATFEKKVEGVVPQAKILLLFQILNRDELFRRCDNVVRNLSRDRIVVVERSFETSRAARY